jgi:glyoxylase-like metal-dependent hydrolase (beta-lactamase superfamily II)
MPGPTLLPLGVQVFERGWLSSNNILLTDADSATLVDSGYVSHSAQTLALLEQALGARSLDRLVNTHLHSDHCGGNAALQQHYPALQTLIPPGMADDVQAWRGDALSYEPTGQNCPPFQFTGMLQPGSVHRWADTDWQVHAAPGHDPHSVILFAPEHRLLISADALWQNGFGVVFPELLGIAAFKEVADSLDLIERLNPALVIPGHGSPFSDVATALAFARQKLEAFTQTPEKHGRYGAKVLLKFKLLEYGSVAKADFMAWALSVPYMGNLHARYAQGIERSTWLEMMLAELQRSGAMHDDGTLLHDVSN